MLVLFLAELNGLESWGTDVGNFYLEANVCKVASPEFGPLEGHDSISFVQATSFWFEMP